MRLCERRVLIEFRQHLAQPDRVAYIAGDASLTYREFDRRADRAAAALAAAGVGRGDRVAMTWPSA